MYMRHGPGNFGIFLEILEIFGSLGILYSYTCDIDLGI